MDKGELGFSDFDAFSESDIYAAGGQGDVLRIGAGHFSLIVQRGLETYAVTFRVTNSPTFNVAVALAGIVICTACLIVVSFANKTTDSETQ